MTFRRPSKKPASRRGYTLMELLLVLAIIVIAAAAVAPSFRRMARNSTLQAAAGDVRAELTRTHVLAMKTGRIHVFQYELGGRKYKVEPWIGDDDALEGKGGDSAAVPVAPLPSTSVDPLLPGERRLPEETKFALGDAAIESRSQRVEDAMLGSGTNAAWSRPILFFPDGSSADAFVVVANDYDVGIRLDLRGMTGAVKVGELTSLQELENGLLAGQ